MHLCDGVVSGGGGGRGGRPIAEQTAASSAAPQIRGRSRSGRGVSRPAGREAAAAAAQNQPRFLCEYLVNIG